MSAAASGLEEARIAALELRINADLGCGRHAQVVAELRRLLAEHPLREGLWALLMRALYSSGRLAEALEAYAQAREVIADELGSDPSAELQQLHEQMLRAGAGPGPQFSATKTAAADSPFAASPPEAPVRDDERAARPARPAAPPRRAVAEPLPLGGPAPGGHHRLHRPGRSCAEPARSAVRAAPSGQPGGGRGGGGDRGRWPGQDHAGGARGAPAAGVLPGRAAVRQPGRRQRPSGRPRRDPGPIPAGSRGGPGAYPSQRGGTRCPVPEPADRPEGPDRPGRCARCGPGAAAAARIRVLRGAGHDTQPHARPGRQPFRGPGRPRRGRVPPVVRQHHRPGPGRCGTGCPG